MKKANRVSIGFGLSVFALWSTITYADPIPIKDFARTPDIGSVTVSPDGRYLALVRAMAGVPSLITLDRQDNFKAQIALGVDGNARSRMIKCDWTNSVRLICFFRSTTQRMGSLVAASTMTAVNADGSEQAYLKPSGFAGTSMFNDGVLDLSSPDADSVLISMYDDGKFFPSVYELNTKTGKTKLQFAGRQTFNGYLSDGQGHLRGAAGFVAGVPPFYFARPLDGGSWKELMKIKSLIKSAGFIRPVAVDSTLNVAYVIAPSEGRDALWSVDLDDKKDPSVVFSHPVGNVTEALLTSSSHLVGGIYQTNRPYAFYTDAVVESAMEATKKSLPAGNYNYLVDRSADEQVFVIGSSNLLDGVTYYLFDRKSGRVGPVGSDYPELKSRTQELGRKQAIRFTARDGVEVVGQLTVPAGKRAENLPLVVMRQSDAFGKEPWRMPFLVQFLASRGYAVFERTSRNLNAGAVSNPSKADADELFYNDLVDGVKWMIGKNMVDSKKICIAGWNMGGYSAYQGAARNADLYRCAISIAGVSDLDSLRGFMMGPPIAGAAPPPKSKGDAPLKSAKEFAMPVLLIHGDLDTVVKVDQSRRMDKALTSAEKKHKYVEIEGADHEFSREADRLTLLTEVEAFLNEYMGAAN